MTEWHPPTEPPYPSSRVRPKTGRNCSRWSPFCSMGWAAPPTWRNPFRPRGALWSLACSQLFREAVDLYYRTTGLTAARALATASSTREAIRAMLRDAVDAFTAPGAPGGCLIILGAINCTVENKSVQDRLSSLRRQISQSILERLKRGQLHTTRAFFMAWRFNRGTALPKRRSGRS
jgi:hypothetical protein